MTGGEDDGGRMVMKIFVCAGVRFWKPARKWIQLLVTALVGVQ